MACYLDMLPKDLRNLLDRYIYQGNWEEFNRILLRTINNTTNYTTFNQRLRSYGLKSWIDTKSHVDVEDLITDDVLIRVVVCACLAIVEKY